MSYAVSNTDEGFDHCGFRTSREAKAFGKKTFPGETIHILDEATLMYVTVHAKSTSTTKGDKQ